MTATGNDLRLGVRAFVFGLGCVVQFADMFSLNIYVRLIELRYYICSFYSDVSSKVFSCFVCAFFLAIVFADVCFDSCICS